ncbi:class I tRNA ligase family protein, partial [Patescibacteria group bacterium]|nr:class I tRNA ligase family protein [Patescibacteria group bacterium]MBU1754869.1 class I tRNA ligase family protein [Patescibacteria group bacterium]
VYIADYVLASYGTGAVMAVPAHDERDYEFAKKMNLPITYVIDPVTGSPQDNPEPKEKIVAIVEHEGKILTVNWRPELGGRLTVGGTLEEGEDPVATAVREIKEETGYSDLELIERADENVHHEYFAHSKNKAWVAHTTLLHFKLKSEAREEQALEEDEKGKFEIEWVSVEQALADIKDPLHTYVLRRFMVGEAYGGNGKLRNSGEFTGRSNREALWDIVEYVGGEKTTNYRIRDWLVSRQRYWGCPIPMVYDPEGNPHPIPSEHLPWTLPTDVDFTPTGKSPLASSDELRARVTKIFGEGWTPEYDTLDTFVDSSWYFLRYLDVADDHDFSDAKLMKQWLPIDRYSGGSEHTTMHLLYARFFHKALYDMALVPTSEPFNERFNRGIILGTDGQKMSKSKGNVINPDEFVQKYGADTVRLYLAFIGPYNEPGSYPWNMDGVEAMRRFLERIARVGEKVEDGEAPLSLQRALAKAGVKVSEDIVRFKFNTAISAIMVALKDFESEKTVSRGSYLTLLQLVAPFAPHLAEHLWETVGGEGSIHAAAWPSFDASLVVDDVITLGVQVNGKTKGTITLKKEASEEEAVAKALEIPLVVKSLNMMRPKKVIYVPGRILNLVSS